MKEKPTYYGILPANVRYDETLKPMEKIMYSEITALSNKEGYCSAKNQYFARLYNVSKETVSRWIGNLSNKGYVSVKLIRDDKKNVIDRLVFLVDTPIDEKINRVLTKRSIAYCEKDQYPIDEKIKENNTSNNITRENINAPTREEKISLKRIETILEDHLGEGYFEALGNREYQREKMSAHLIWQQIAGRCGQNPDDPTDLEQTYQALEHFTQGLKELPFWKEKAITTQMIANKFTQISQQLIKRNGKATNNGPSLDELYERLYQSIEGSTNAG